MNWMQFRKCPWKYLKVLCCSVKYLLLNVIFGGGLYVKFMT